MNQGEVVVTLRVDGSKLVAGIKDAEGQVKSFTKNVDGESNSIKSKLESFGHSFTNLGRNMSLALTAPVTAFAAFSAKSASDMQQWTVAFETMLGSASKASTLLEDIRKFAATTPFNQSDLIQAAKSLLAYNIEAEKIIPTLNTLGNIAAGVGTDKMPQLILALGQVRAAGQLTGAELRQFTEAGVPLLDELAKAAGKSVSQMKNDMENGMAPTFAEVETALGNLSKEGGRFFNLMQRQSLTTAGQFSNLQDKAQMLAAGLGEKLLPALNTIMNALSGLLTWFTQLSPNTQNFIIALTLIAAAVGPIIVGLGLMAAAIAALSAPILIAIAAVTALAVTAALVIAYWEPIKGFFAGLWQWVINGLAGLASFFIGTWNNIRNAVSSAWNGVKDAVNNGINSVVSFTSELPGKILKSLGNVGSTLYNAGKDLINGFMNGIKDYAQNAVNAARDAANGAVDAVKRNLGIQSPSKVFAEIGGYMMEGLSVGIVRGTDSVTNSLLAASGAMTAAFSSPSFAYDTSFNAGAYLPDTPSSGSSSVPKAINQTNNIYTEVDMDIVNRKLAKEINR